MNKLNNKKGISLIVLVITIIVMIILATAIILSLQSSGIIGRANEASSKSDESNMIQAANVAYGEYLLERNLGQTNVEAEEYVKDKLSSNFNQEELKKLSVLSDGTIQILPTIPTGFTLSIYEGEQKISEGLVVYETTAETLASKSQEEAMTTFNQYVWIPVNGEFKRIAWNDEDLENNFVEPLRAGIEYMDDISKYTGEIEQYNEMKASVEKNGGFYIARYEAGKEGTTAVSKKGATVWNNITFDTTWSAGQNGFGVDTNDGAAKVSKVEYKDASNKVVAKRHLIYGVQWDAALKFIEDSEHSVTDSSTWGNYRNYNASVASSKQVDKAGSLTPAGYSEYWKAKNIYDMAGNVYEWTYESYAGFGLAIRVLRGSCFDTEGWNNFGVSMRLANPGYWISDVGFRLALYLK